MTDLALSVDSVPEFTLSSTLTGLPSRWEEQAQDAIRRAAGEPGLAALDQLADTLGLLVCRVRTYRRLSDDQKAEAAGLLERVATELAAAAIRWGSTSDSRCSPA